MSVAFDTIAAASADSDTSPAISAEPACTDDLSREVFGVLGMPIDAVGLAASITALERAIENREPFLLSTPNVNFLIRSQRERLFQESLLLSDLCPADGMPIVWIARLLGAPIKNRLSGSDLFEALKNTNRSGKRWGVFLFGGADDVAARVGKAINSSSSGLKCVGMMNPGFGTVEEMSSETIIRTINESGADFLAVFLSAKKAQEWLLHNHDRLTIPVRGQFGATINFEAGILERAPQFLRHAGLEWLWRIKEEPYLWRRYWSDGKRLLRLVFTRLLPLMADAGWSRIGTGKQFKAAWRERADRVAVRLSGSAVARHIDQAVQTFRAALAHNKAIEVDLAEIRSLDARFFGLLLMVRKQLRNRGHELRFVGASQATTRAFHRNGFECLLSN